MSSSTTRSSRVQDPSARRLEGKVALITGGASGIGATIVRLFGRHGAQVIIADIQDELGRAICNDAAMEGCFDFIHCDVTEEDDVCNAVDYVVSKYSKLDIMFSNAGISETIKSSSIMHLGKEDLVKVFNVNVFGAFFCAKHAARVMIPMRRGSILFTASIASVHTPGILHSYIASKHAVVGLAKNLCVELGQHGIRVNCISPYGIATPLAKSVFEMDESKITEMISNDANLKGVKFTAEDVADAALYLASDESKYVSGVNLIIDGGYTLRASIAGSSIANASQTNICLSRDI